MDNREQDPQARILLDHMVRLLQEVAQHNPNMVERVKLQHISRNLVCITNIPNLMISLFNLQAIRSL